MTAPTATAFSDARTRAARRPSAPFGLLAPAAGVVVLLFGGGLALGLAQSLGYLPAAGMSELSLAHFIRVLGNPDFFTSLGLTFYLPRVHTECSKRKCLGERIDDAGNVGGILLKSFSTIFFLTHGSVSIMLRRYCSD